MSMFDALAGLDGNRLLRLAGALEAGLLAPPIGAFALQNHIPASEAEAVSESLDQLTQHRLSPVQIALVLRAFAAGRQCASPDVAGLIDVVTSGPDVEATARDTGVVTRQLCGAATERVLAVGFVVRQGRSVFRALAARLDADERLQATLCIDVRRQHAQTSLNDRIVERFARDFVENEWPGTRLPDVYYDPRSLAPVNTTRSALHAKCIVIDGREALVTSANFTEAAQERNIELGILVRSAEVASRIERHFQAMIDGGILVRLPVSQ